MTISTEAVAAAGLSLPLSCFAAADRREIDVVLTDIDDTLTLDGRLPATAYAALERLRDAGKRVIPVTGRPAGWCDLIARLWPVDAVVGENGAFYFRRDPAGGIMRRYDRAAEQRRADQARLLALGSEILAAVPEARIAADQPYRESDLAIDFAEDVSRLDDRKIDRIVSLFDAAGATAKVSSIHVNGWFGDYDKLGMTANCLAELFGIDVDRDNHRIVYVGDSPNDEPMFRFFRNGVAVANFAAFADRVRHQPRFITGAAGGDGFAEVAEALLSV